MPKIRAPIAKAPKRDTPKKYKSKPHANINASGSFATCGNTQARVSILSASTYNNQK